jgi:uncharacterized protein YggT (Ycf19 family)
MTAKIAQILVTLGTFYGWLIVAYVLMSWVPIKGVFADIYQVLDSLVQPYLRLFKWIPPIGALDFSPLVAFLVLQWVVQVLANALRTLA